MPVCIDVMERAFAAFGRGDVLQPVRTVIHRPDGTGSLYVMPAYTVEPHALSVKVLTAFHGNPARGIPSHQGTVLAFDPDSGALAALIDAASLTAIRTAAVSGLATRLLAREDATNLALIGSGVQALSHIAAMRTVRPITRIRVWSPDAKRLRNFVETASTLHDVPITATDGPGAALAGADIICTVSSAREPVLCSEWIADGAHINAVGASTPGTREVDTDTIVRARVYVDSRQAALAEAGDLLIPIAEGVVGPEVIVAELADLVADPAHGRRAASCVTLFKSVGLALEDAAAAGYLLDRA
jgi:ornithine cyclodeaminase